MKIIKYLLASIIIFVIWLLPVLLRSIEECVWLDVTASMMYMLIGGYIAGKFMNWFDSHLKKKKDETAVINITIK